MDFATICYGNGQGALFMSDIREFTALDQRLEKQQQVLETRLAELETDLRHSQPEQQQTLKAELQELKSLQQRLQQSRKLVRQAHDLRQGRTIEIREAPYRLLGLGLIIFSAIAAVALGIYVFQTL